MNREEQAYLDLLRNILDNGSERSDRTGVGTKSIFGTMLRFSLDGDRFPILTTKRVFYRGAIEEMLFFIRGETDTKKLEAKDVNIWKGNTSREFLDKRGLGYLNEGSLGLGYGFQWRSFDGGRWREREPTDQLEQVFQSIKSDPYSRRHIVSAWNPNQIDQMALPPCHYSHQYYVDDGTLSCLWNQRSVDAAIGLPMNIVGYALLTRLMAAATGLKAKEVIFCGGDTHVYSNHFDAVKEQLTREPYPFPKMTIKKDIASIADMEALSFEDFEITGYTHHSAIPMEMSV
jgi:thymidylate synthase